MGSLLDGMPEETRRLLQSGEAVLQVALEILAIQDRLRALFQADSLVALGRRSFLERQHSLCETAAMAALETVKICGWPHHSFEADQQAALATVKLGVQ